MEYKRPKRASTRADGRAKHCALPDLSRLGAGGMGEVYLAEDTRLNRKVAIKLLVENSVSDPQSKKRLIREAQSAATLDHPQICSTYA